MTTKTEPPDHEFRWGPWLLLLMLAWCYALWLIAGWLVDVAKGVLL